MCKFNLEWGRKRDVAELFFEKKAGVEARLPNSLGRFAQVKKIKIDLLMEMN